MDRERKRLGRPANPALAQFTASIVQHPPGDAAEHELAVVRANSLDELRALVAGYFDYELGPPAVEREPGERRRERELLEPLP